MSLGTALEADLNIALANSESSTDSSTLIASAINTYLSGAVYGDGAVTWSGSVSSDDFKLVTSGTASQAASQWATGVMKYWGASGVATGSAGTATTLDTVIAPILVTASTVGPELTSAFTTIFSAVSGTQSGKATSLASAIEAAVGNIIVSWQEFTAGPPPVTTPFTGGVA